MKLLQHCRRAFWCASIVGMSMFMSQNVRAAETAKADDWVYLDNGVLRLGVDKVSGACIGYLSASGSTRNILNHYDRGRFVQQSYYGDADGSLWAKQAWRYNPVQGGDYKGAPSVVQELRIDGASLYAKVTPRHWANGALLPEVTMEEWIELKGSLVQIKFRMTYNGDKTHAARHQEIPAIFVEPQFATLVTYEGAQPWTNEAVARKQPGWPNQMQRLTENWVAYVDEHDFGVGAYVPIATEATCYRYQGGANSNCSYVAPIATFALKPGLVFEYTAFLTLGNSSQIRARFQRLHEASKLKTADKIK